jgi:hypothetical protein
MTIVDERGRIAGRVNAVDAAAVVVLFLLIPLAIAAYLLFRTPAPTLDGITPRTLVEGPNQRLEIDGANLRPFMRVSFDTIPASSFLLGSTKYALVDVPALKPGAYDVVLWDYAREVARLPKALTVAPLATDVQLELVGVFKSPPDEIAAQLKAGARLPSSEHPIAEVVSVGEAVPGLLRLGVGDDTITVPLKGPNLAAVLRVTCATVRTVDGAARCTVSDGDQQVVVAPDALFTVPTAAGPVVFQMTSARPAKAAAPDSR